MSCHKKMVRIMRITVDVKEGKANIAVEDVDLAGTEFLKSLMVLGGQWLQASLAPAAPGAAEKPEESKP